MYLCICTVQLLVRPQPLGIIFLLCLLCTVCCASRFSFAVSAHTWVLLQQWQAVRARPLMLGSEPHRLFSPSRCCCLGFLMSKITAVVCLFNQVAHMFAVSFWGLLISRDMAADVMARFKRFSVWPLGMQCRRPPPGFLICVLVPGRITVVCHRLQHCRESSQQ